MVTRVHFQSAAMQELKEMRRDSAALISDNWTSYEQYAKEEEEEEEEGEGEGGGEGEKQPKQTNEMCKWTAYVKFIFTGWNVTRVSQ